MKRASVTVAKDLTNLNIWVRASRCEAFGGGFPKTRRATASWWERGGLGRAVVVPSRLVGAAGPQKY